MDLEKHRIRTKKKNIRKRGGFSLIIMPHYQGKMKIIKITSKQIYSGLVVFVVLIALATSFVFSYKKLSDEVAFFKGMKFDDIVSAQARELQQVQDEVTKTKSKLGAFEEYIVYLSSLEKQVRDSLNLGDSKVSLEYVLDRTPLAKLESSDELPVNVAQLLYEQSNVTSIAEDRAETLNLLKDAADEYNVLLAQTPNIWPLQGYISSYFGWRINPFGGGWQFHEGIDICAYYGAPIRATADGTVKYTGWCGGYGYTIGIYHRDSIETLYGHLSRIVVKYGETVKKGQVIGYEGNSGFSTGPHLHYEIRVNGISINPLDYLK
jgi:murein DD-endopeptidase MepM/ murein hydrolase activator NlpD